MAQNAFATIRDTESQISKVQQELSKFEGKLSGSPTAASSLTVPTTKDVSNEVQKNALQSKLVGLQKQNLSARWYGDEVDSSPDQGSSPGVIASALTALSRPLHTVVKGVKKVIGDETEVEGQDFIDLFRQHGKKGPLWSAAGFGLDVMFDPVNWLTAGTAALIPRIGAGFVKGGMKGGVSGAVKGAATGATSNLQQKAAFIASHVPFTAGAESSFAKKLSEKAYASYQNFKHLTGTPEVESYAHLAGIGRTINTGKLGALAPDVERGATLGDIYKGFLSLVPSGDDFVKATYYDSRNWLDLKKMQDIQDRLKAKSSAESLAAGAPSPAVLEARESETLREGLLKMNPAIIKNVPPGKEMDAVADLLNKKYEEQAFINDHPAEVFSSNPEQNMTRLLQEVADAEQTGETLAALDLYGSAGPTGIKWYDSLLEWGNSKKMTIGGKQVSIIKEFNDVYQSLIDGAFRPFHTALSPLTHVYNILSTHTMYLMAGLSNLRGFSKGYRKALLGLSGVHPDEYIVDALLGEGKTINDALRAADVRVTMSYYPGQTAKTLGVGSDFFFGHRTIKEAVNMARNQGLVTAEQVASGAAARDFVALHEELRHLVRDELVGKPTLLEKFAGVFRSKVYNPAPSSSDIAQALRERVEGAVAGGAPLEVGQEVAGITVRDARTKTELLKKVDKIIEAKANAGSAPAQIYRDLMKSARALYEHEDQAARIAIVDQLINHGVSEDELRVLSRFVPTRGESDIISTSVRNGKKVYRMSYDYALGAASELFINYAAMPAAVRLIRSMPLVGAPFVSFTYGMGIKTLQTLAYNPAFFNKVSYAIAAASGPKTPIEKRSLESKYYDWYKKPYMLRVPDQMNFLGQYPIYLNLANALPYYSLNIFQPASRSYSSVLPDTVVKTLDTLPVLKDPFGQMLFDNIVLPSILSGTERPKSAVGAELYPIGASASEKAFYAGRSLVDAFTPNIIAPVGLVLPQEYSKYYPGRRTRQMAAGKYTGSPQYPSANAEGIPSTEPAESRTIRNILGYLGIPVNRLNTSYESSKAKNELK